MSLPSVWIQLGCQRWHLVGGEGGLPVEGQCTQGGRVVGLYNTKDKHTREEDSNEQVDDDCDHAEGKDDTEGTNDESDDDKTIGNYEQEYNTRQDVT